MGDAALDGITVYKDSKNTYHYIVNFHNITVGQSSDGISRFWVNGTEYPVTSTGGANNQLKFTLQVVKNFNKFQYQSLYKLWKILCLVQVKKMPFFL